MAYCKPLKRKMMKIIKVFNVTPVPKPRMTRRDGWTMAIGRRHKARKCVLDWLCYREEIQWQAEGFEMPESGYHVIFVLPMPRSWSPKKRQEMEGQPHQSEKGPDKDNLEKALLDALCPGGDAHIWDGRPTKVWGYEGMVIIMVTEPPSLEEIKKTIAMAKKMIPANKGT
jgi:Holliday junction resolvase RusA-like endonuclease